jgi:hypothetical protein
MRGVDHQQSQIFSYLSQVRLISHKNSSDAEASKSFVFSARHLYHRLKAFKLLGRAFGKGLREVRSR